MNKHINRLTISDKIYKKTEKQKKKHAKPKDRVRGCLAFSEKIQDLF
jgi:hypothetical protein